MRWFWLFIATLALFTGVLSTLRVRNEYAQQQAQQAQPQGIPPGAASRPSRPRPAASQLTTDPVQTDQTSAEPPDTAPAVDASLADQSASQETAGQSAVPARDLSIARVPKAVESLPEPEPPAYEAVEPAPSPDPDPDPSAAQSFTSTDHTTQLSEPAPQPAPQELGPTAPIARGEHAQPDESDGTSGSADSLGSSQLVDASITTVATPVEPAQDPDTSVQASGIEPGKQAPASFELRADGSLRIIDADVWIRGAGTASAPYVLGWDALKSIERIYDPKKGKDKLPDWLDHLNGKVVSIEGNTLVPVVATTTRELLIMKNPWDGCCIGVPPTPYDAVEVVLNHDVDFGNSAVGFGSVQGTFYLDPYIVDGWVLGIYIVEDAKYRSGEGVVFPDF